MQLKDSGVDCKDSEEMDPVLQHLKFRETIVQKLKIWNNYETDQAYLMHYITALLKTLK